MKVRDEAYLLPLESDLSLSRDAIIARSKRRFESEIDTVKALHKRLDESGDAFIEEALAPLEPERRRAILEAEPDIEVVPLAFPGARGSIQAEWHRPSWERHLKAIPRPERVDFSQVRTAPPRVITAKDKPKEDPWTHFRAPYEGWSWSWMYAGKVKGWGDVPSIFPIVGADAEDGCVAGTNLIQPHDSGPKIIGCFASDSNVGVSYRLREHGHVKAIVELEVIASSFEAAGGGIGFTKAIDIQLTNLQLLVDGHSYGDRGKESVASVISKSRFGPLKESGAIYAQGQRVFIELEELTYYPKGWVGYVEIGLNCAHVAVGKFCAVMGYQAAQFFVRSIALTTVKGGVPIEEQPPPPPLDPDDLYRRSVPPGWYV